LYDRFYIDAERAKGVQFAWRQATFDQGRSFGSSDTDVTGDSKKSRAAGRQATTNLNSPNPLNPSEN
jgi:hypothetical protein